MIQKFSDKAQKVIVLAEGIAFDMKNAKVGTEHILLGILKVREAKLRILLEPYNITFETVRLHLTQKQNPKEGRPYFMEYTLETRRLLDRSIIESAKLNEEKVSVDTLSYSLLDLEDTTAVDILKLKGINITNLKAQMRQKSKKTSDLDSIDELVNLNEKAVRNNTIVIGRDKEVEKIIQILLRKTKSNPLLVGEPGVGKTAIAEYLALKIAKGEVPLEMRDKVVYELDIPSVIAGTKYRGEFEEKLRKIIKKVKENQNAIVFIDEIHNVVGAGGAEGAIDASNILKPFLARNEFKCIGATTYDEYVKRIEKERALERRFQYLFIEEPTAEQTYEILLGLRQSYSNYHNVTISDQNLKLIVDLTNSYIKNRNYPDKAIDVLDFCCVKTKQLNEQIVSDKTIEKVIEDMANVQIQKEQKINIFKEQLASKIKGQEQAINTIAKHFEKISLGLIDEQRPLGVFLFVGPTGIGKSETAKVIAKTYFGHEDKLVRLDMSEFSESSSVTKLVGSSPGYVGHDTPTYLNDCIRKHPHSVVLLDEIEKAHKDVCNLLLQVFDEGYYLDSQKRKVDFHNALIIMTSNIGYVNSDTKDNFGFKKNQKSYISSQVEKFFAPEFINRIDEIIEYKQLDISVYKQIVVEQLQSYQTKSKAQFLISDELINKIIEESDYSKYGVRAIKRTIKKHCLEYINNEKTYT